MGIPRRALLRVLAGAATAAGAEIRRSTTAVSLENTDGEVRARFSDGTEGGFDLAIGADGIYSQTRRLLFPDGTRPEFVGQAVWRYNLPRPADFDAFLQEIVCARCGTDVNGIEFSAANGRVVVQRASGHGDGPDPGLLLRSIVFGTADLDRTAEILKARNIDARRDRDRIVVAAAAGQGAEFIFEAA